MVFTIFNSLFLLAFALSALVQYNDPDPIAWITIYLSAAVMCLDQHKQPRLPWLAPALLIISITWIALLIPNLGTVSATEIVESISMKTRTVEEAREIGGLSLIVVWAAIVVIRRRRR